MNPQEIIALVVLFFWTVGVGLLCLSMLLGHHHRGKPTYNWVKRLYERLDKEQP
jgi:hypothetical protein